MEGHTNSRMWCNAVKQQRRSAAPAGAPPVLLPPDKPSRRKAVGVGPLLSIPGFFQAARQLAVVTKIQTFTYSILSLTGPST